MIKETYSSIDDGISFLTRNVACKCNPSQLMCLLLNIQEARRWRRRRRRRKEREDLFMLFSFHHLTFMRVKQNIIRSEEEIKSVTNDESRVI